MNMKRMISGSREIVLGGGLSSLGLVARRLIRLLALRV